VIALFITTTVVTVMFIVVMQEAGISTNWAGRMFGPAICLFHPRRFGGKLMFAVPAEVLLITIRIFAVTIK
jgi:hypothetical protein